MHLTVLLWGFTAIFGRALGLPAISLVWYRLVITSVILFLLLPILRISYRITRQQLVQYALVGVLISGHWIFFYSCIKHDGIAVAVISLSTITFFTALFEPIYFHRKLRIAELIIGTLVVLGVSFLVSEGIHASPIGLVLGLLSALTSAGFGVLNGKYARHARGELLAFYELFFAMLVTTAAIFIFPKDFVRPSELPQQEILLLVMFSVFFTILPWLSSFAILRRLTPYTFALAVTLEPIYAIAFAYVLYPESEKLSVTTYIGTALIIALIVANTYLKRPRPGTVASSASGVREAPG